MLVYLALDQGAGGPRDLMSHMEIEQVAAPGDYTEMMDVLDTEYFREDYVKADEVSQVYERMRRDHGMTMKDYLLQLRRAKRMLEKEDKGATISDTSFSRSGLNTTEQRQVLGACGAVWDSVKIGNSLQLMFLDAHKVDKRRLASSGIHTGYRKPFRPTPRGGTGQKQPWRPTQKAAEVFEANADSAMESGEPDGSEEKDEEEEASSEDDRDDDNCEQMFETYYQGLKAKKKLMSNGF